MDQATDQMMAFHLNRENPAKAGANLEQGRSPGIDHGIGAPCFPVDGPNLVREYHALDGKALWNRNLERIAGRMRAAAVRSDRADNRETGIVEGVT